MEASGVPRPGLAQVPGDRYGRLHEALDADVKKAVDRKLRHLAQDPRYPGLRLVRLCPLHWRIWVSVNYRLVFSCDDASLHLLFVGSHDDYDRWRGNNC